MSDDDDDECAIGDEALSSSLWTGGRSRAWSTHILVCAICSARAERVAAAHIASARRRGSA